MNGAGNGVLGSGITWAELQRNETAIAYLLVGHRHRPQINSNSNSQNVPFLEKQYAEYIMQILPTLHRLAS